MRIAVAGGTGTVGRFVVEALRNDGHEPITLSRSTGVDLSTGAGLAGALAGVSAVVDVAATPASSAAESVKFFGTVTRNLLEAEKAAGVPHHVALSIVGATRVKVGYYVGKKVQEDLVTASPHGWSLLRATQFHEFVARMFQIGKVGPLSFAPWMVLQPVSAAEVGAALAAIAVGEPRGIDTAMAGPEQERMVTMVRRYVRATGQRRPVFQVPVPGAWGRAMRNGSLLPEPGTRIGRQTFDDWIATLPAA
jgi:uncharacterized protein YbjT (DUF2867 family)